MDLRWWLVAIAGCVALAVGIAAAALWPTDGRRELRPLANTARLTRLPEYRRAVRMRSIWLTVSTLLLVAGVIAAVLAAARPTGLPSAANGRLARPAQDIMVCTGAPATDPAVAAVLGYFAEHAPTLAAERIGLTSANRRVIPLTRDYQYAAAQFADVARPRGGRRLTADVSYADYAGGLADVLAMCLTGFPHFDAAAGAPRSLIYVGPGNLRAAEDPRPQLFSTDRVRELATGGSIQVNALVSGHDGGAVDQLVRATGGRSHPADGDTAAHLADILAHPPPASGASGDVATRTLESPDIPLVLALLAAAGLLVWRVVRR
ncbi:hypothetical protein ACXPWS_30995 [Mycobacterium sp. BMJ-28]